MSRDFDAVDDVINCGSPAALDDVNTFTYAAWIFPDTFGENLLGRVIDKSTKLLLLDNTVGGGSNQFLSASVTRATTSAQAQGAANSISTGAWQFVAFTYDGTDGPRLFKGALGGAVAELGYISRVVGSGAETSDAANDLLIGNNAAGTRTFDGRIAEVAVYNVRLSADELTQLMYGMRPRPQNLILYPPLWGVASPEPDLSGNGNNGTVTGAVLGNHSPTGLYAPRPRWAAVRMPVAVAAGQFISWIQEEVA